MDVSIIIVNYNTKDLTVNCIKSVYSSETKYSYEIILVDNASSDGSTDTIKRHFPDVKLIENKVNVGFGRANNQAAMNAKGRYLYLLNSDTEIEKDVIERVVSYGDSNRAAGVIGTKVIYPDGNWQENFYKFPSFLSELVFFTVNIIKSLKWFPFRLNKYRNYLLNEPFEVDVISGCSMFVKREVYQSIGLFNENFFMYYEDSEFCYRVKQNGFKSVYFPEVFVKHFHMKSGKGDRQKFITHVTCFKSSCIYFKCLKKSFQLSVFKLTNFFIWLLEFSLFNILNLFLKKEKLNRKIVMLRMLLLESANLSGLIPWSVHYSGIIRLFFPFYGNSKNNTGNNEQLAPQHSFEEHPT